MSDILCVTNRTLCEEEFLLRIEKIARTAPAGIILREKDLSEEDYLLLARQVIKICREHKVPCILHTFADAAIALQAEAVHLPLPILRQLPQEKKARFSVLGSSCHSVEEAQEARRLGCTYITAGHIFPTDCKKGLAPRGLAFLEDVCRSVDIPVYAIGGITPANRPLALQAGAQGVCVMSGMMRGSLSRCTDVSH